MLGDDNFALIPLFSMEQVDPFPFLQTLFRLSSVNLALRLPDRKPRPPNLANLRISRAKTANKLGKKEILLKIRPSSILWLAE
jgi:hypothetical protein